MGNVVFSEGLNIACGSVRTDVEIRSEVRESGADGFDLSTRGTKVIRHWAERR